MSELQNRPLNGYLFSQVDMSVDDTKEKTNFQGGSCTWT